MNASVFRSAKPFAGLAIVGVLVGGAALARAADTVSIRVESLGRNQYRIGLQTQVGAPQIRLWSVLTDYDHHAGFLPYMIKSQVAESTGNVKLVDQEGRIRILFWTFTMRVRQRVTESPPHEMAFAAIDGDFKRLEGTWHLMEHSAAATDLQCSFLVEPKKHVPAWAVRMAADRYLKKMVARLRQRAEAS